MKTIKFLTYSVFVLLLSISIASCSGDDGATGANGADGINGQNGADGNANVNTYTFDTSSFNSSSWAITTSLLTDDVLANDAILTYLKYDFNDNYYPIPGTSNDIETKVILTTSSIDLYFSNRSTGGSLVPNVGDYDLLKMVIIESSSTTTGKTITTKKEIYTELENANIDVNNYYAVCDYYGINPE